MLARKAKKGTVPPLWDGHAGEHIAGILVDRLLPAKAANLKVI